MSLTDRIAIVEGELAAERGEIAAAAARVRGLEAELMALRAAVSGVGELTQMPRTEAILMVLRQAEGTMSPTAILDALHAANRTDELRSITATLDHLYKQKRVRRAARGRYLPT